MSKGSQKQPASRNEEGTQKLKFLGIEIEGRRDFILRVLGALALAVLGIGIGVVLCYFWLSRQPFWLDPLIGNAVKATVAAQPTVTLAPTYEPYPTYTFRPTWTPMLLTPTPTNTPTPTPTPAVVRSELVALRTVHNTYVTAMNDQSGWDWKLKAETTVPSDWEQFLLLYLDNGKVALETFHRRFVTATDDAGCCDWVLRAETQVRGTSEEFTLIDLGGGKIAFRTFRDKYVTASDAWQCWLVRAETERLSDWEKFELVVLE